LQAKKLKFSVTSYACICVELDFSKWFPAKIILTCKNYSWTQNLDYERISLRCRVCFETGHIAAQCPKGNRKAQKRQRTSTWWNGSNEDHQLIIKNSQSHSSLHSVPDSPSRDSAITQDLKPHSNGPSTQENPPNQSKDSDPPEPGNESKASPAPI